MIRGLSNHSLACFVLSDDSNRQLDINISEYWRSNSDFHRINITEKISSTQGNLYKLGITNIFVKPSMLIRSDKCLICNSKQPK